MTVDLVPVARTTLDRLEALGVDLAAVLRHASLPSSRFEGAKAHLATREFFAFWRAVEDVGGVRGVGLRLGGDASPQQNVASMAALHAPSFGEALRKLARYKRLVCPEQVMIGVARGEARVRFEWVLAEEDPPATLIDGVFASAAQLARRGTGKELRPRRLELTRRRSDEALLAKHFGCPVKFDAPADLLVFDGKALAEPFVTHNPELLAVLVPGLEAALREGGVGAPSLLDDVRAVLSQRICGERPAVDKVAKALGLSGRTLQRRLEELGTSYQRLLDDVRHRSARRLLSNTDLDPGEVAFLLGFEEFNSFTRAFHGWEGTTPARWRAARAEEPAADQS
ncbi:MAG TPA: AraC family transcriptional regulator ligand-binding domain-containing protein [Polyangiaceae bacterium]